MRVARPHSPMPMSTVPCRAACERARGVRIAHGVETELHQVGVRHFVALATQLGRRLGGHGHTDPGVRHKSNKIKKASSTVRAEEASKFGRASGVSGHSGCLF